MTYSELEAFLTIIEHESFSAASKSLFITQPALSRKIKYLENELGFNLFIRKRGVHDIMITPEGKEFIEIAQKIKTAMELSYRIPHIKPNKITVIYENGLYTYMKGKIINTFLSKTDGVHFSSSSSSSSEAYSLVEQGLADIAITTKPQELSMVDTIPLLKMRMIVVSKKPLSDSNVISSAILDPSKELHIPWSEETEHWHISKFGHNTRPVISTDQKEIFDSFTHLDDIWFLAPPSVYEMDKDKYKFYCYELEDAPNGIEMFYVKRKHVNTYLIDLYIDSVREILHNIAELY